MSSLDETQDLDQDQDQEVESTEARPVDIPSPMGLSDEAFSNLKLEDVATVISEVTGEAPKASTEDAQEDAEEASEEPQEGSVEPSEEVDYKTEYQRVFAPFKANGRDMQVTNAEDARRLMQMGANYNKKMAGLKPHLKVVKMLEQSQLLNEESVAFLIDLKKKNPEAIAKFLKEECADLDLYSLQEDNSKKYVPTSRAPTDSELDLDTVLDDLKELPVFDTMITELTEKWDEDSRGFFLGNPQYLRPIAEHMQNGAYDFIRSKVEEQRVLGNLEGVNDINAYKAVGDALHARGLLTQYFQPKGSTASTPASETVTHQRRELNTRRMAAAPIKGGGSGSREAINPLSMSDADFEKFRASSHR